MRPRTSPRRLARFALALVVLPSLARAQSPGLEVDVDANRQNQEMFNQQQGFINLPANYLDQVLFGHNGGNNVGDYVRKRNETQLKLKIQDIDRACKLTPEQKARLELAGRGDFQRFMALVEPKRRYFASGKVEMAKFNNVWQDVQPLQLKYQKLLEPPDSLFAKILDQTLKPEQKSKYAEVISSREAYRARAAHAASLVTLDGQLGLTSAQRKYMLELLDGIKIPATANSVRRYALFYELGRVSDADMKAFLTDSQIKRLQPQIDQAKQLEQYLTRNGYVPLKDPLKPKALLGKDRPARPDADRTKTAETSQPRDK